MIRDSGRTPVLALLVAVVLIAGCASTGERAGPRHPRVLLKTDAGDVTLELRPDLAPAHVERFLRWAEGRGGESGSGSYAGTGVCEARGGAYLVLGCPPPENPFARPGPAGDAQELPEEVDRVALGLDDRRIAEFKEVDLLWQREIYPLARRLEEAGEPLPGGLATWISALRERGEEAVTLIEGMTWHEYLGGMGYAHRAGASGLSFERGALAAASYWPGASDERFLVSLIAIPEREGRATVFGRVVAGLDVLEDVAARPVNRVRVPETPLVIHEVRRAGESAASR